jgi:hypothetical protein
VPLLPGAWEVGDWPQACRELAQRLAAPAQAFRVSLRPGIPLLTDDSGVLDRLQERRLARQADLLLGSVP